HYQQALSQGNTHSAGIENQTGTVGNQFFRGTGSLPANTAVRYTPIPTGGVSNLTVNTSGGGTTTFAGAVGGANPLASVTTNADGATAINGGSHPAPRAQRPRERRPPGGHTHPHPPPAP